MISIIIPAWNEEKYLPKLLECIKKQTYKDYEIIVADADSKDKTRQIAKKYGCKIVKGGMPAAGRNNGAEAAKGDILLFLDADSQIDDNFVKNALNEIEKRKIDIAGCRIKPLSNKMAYIFGFSVFNLWSCVMQFIFPHASGSGIFCKKSLHNKIKGFDNSIKFAEDVDYVSRGSRYGKFRIIKNVEVFVSSRRYENEGMVKTGVKLLMVPFYRLFFGEIRGDIFKYSLRYRK